MSRDVDSSQSKRDVILAFHSSPDAILNALHQGGWAIVPRDEIERLREALERIRDSNVMTAVLARDIAAEALGRRD